MEQEGKVKAKLPYRYRERREGVTGVEDWGVH